MKSLTSCFGNWTSQNKFSSKSKENRFFSGECDFSVQPSVEKIGTSRCFLFLFPRKSQTVFFYPKLCFPFHCFRSLLPRLQPQPQLRLRLMAKSLVGKSNCGKKVMGTYWGSERMIFFVSVRKEEEELEALKKFSFLVFVFLGDCVIKLCLISNLNQCGSKTD